ncbi:MAG: ABC transporter substrate-binding protein [Granulosicoccus sp.]|nr:ABC transporter substrate-binding protein [Granulosicoccus sp.]
MKRQQPVVIGLLMGLLMAGLCAHALAAKTSLTLGMQLEPPNLDPTGGAAAAIDEVVYANIFEGLTRFGPDGSVKPALAKEWSIENDGARYVFTLHDGVTFHDGASFTAEDVKFSLDRARADDSTNAQKQLFANIDSVEVVDDQTVAINLMQADGSLLFNLAWGDAVILDEASAADAATKPIGTGPFVFENWVQGDRIEIVKNNDYWGAPVQLERAVFKFISEPTAAYSALLAGDVDAFPVYPAPENLAQFDADPNFSVVVGSTEGETILAINNTKPPFDDVRVRQAISHAINREEIIDGAMYGFGTPIGSHFAPHHPAYLDLVDNSVHDPDQARELLAQAGLEEGLSISLKLPPPAYARRGGEIIAAQLRDVGITASIENVEWAQWLEQVFKGKDFDLTIVSHTEPMDIGIYAKPDYYFGYDNTDLQELMTSFTKETDTEQRTALLQDAQRMISDDFVNGYLFQLAKTGVANTKIKGLWENSPTQANDLTGVYWEE